MILQRVRFLLVAVSLGLLCGASAPHTEGEDYVFLRFLDSAIEGRFELHFDDLREKLGLALDASETRAPADVAAAAPAIQAYIRDHFEIGPAHGVPYLLEFTDTDSIVLPKGAFAQLSFRIPITALPDALRVHHRMFYEQDPVHRGLLCVEYNAKTDTTYPAEYTALVFCPKKQLQVLDLNLIPSIFGPREMISQGAWHLLNSAQQTLFLLAILASSVLVFRQGWQPADNFRSAFWGMAYIVGAFCVAHSAALFLSALGLLEPPVLVVTAAVALSIALVAINNITGLFADGRIWLVATLGVAHGLALASALGDLPFRMGDLFRVVIGFNLGIELGIAIIVAIAFPALFALRRSRLYQPLLLRAGSALLILASAWWIMDGFFALA